MDEIKKNVIEQLMEITIFENYTGIRCLRVPNSSIFMGTKAL